VNVVDQRLHVLELIVDVEDAGGVALALQVSSC